MAAQFAWPEFERLGGTKLSRYVLDTVESGDLPSDQVDYVRENANRLDGQHLEMALLLLKEDGSQTAVREIAKHVGHPLEHIRLTVIGILAQMETLDNDSLSIIENRLKAVRSAFERQGLERILRKIAPREK